jgi:hypothetical protein
MKYYFTLLIHFILLITTPMTLLACPQLQFIDNPPNPLRDDLEDDVEDELPTYDDFLKFREEVEADDLEKYTLDQMVARKRTGILKERQLNITNTFVYTLCV